MAEMVAFERRVADTLLCYADEAAPTLDAATVAPRAALGHPRRAGLGLLPWRLVAMPRVVWVLLVAGLLVALIGGMLLVGSQRRQLPAVVPPVGPALTTPRGFHFATLQADGRVLIIGGSIGIMQGLTSAELYDPSTGTFSSTGSMEMPGSCRGGTALADGQVLIVGGGDGSKAEIYDPETGTFRPTGSLTTARCDPTAALLADGQVLIVGGEDGSKAEIYDPETGTFRPTGSLTTAVVGQTATLLADGRVLVAGGQGASGALASAELYDPRTGTFHVTGTMTTAGEVTATRLLDGRVLITGGGNGSKAEVYDPTTGTFKPTGSLKTPRWQQTATLLPDGRVLVAGGQISTLGSVVPLSPRPSCTTPRRARSA